MSYKTYYFRAADRQTLLDGVSQTFSDEGVDPSRLIGTDLNGQKQVRPSIGIFLSSGEWWETKPEHDEDGNKVTDGVRGQHALANVRTNDPHLQDVFESVTVGETQNGVTRVEPTTPVREFA